jgi:Fe-S-cluster containining protein
MAHNLDCQACGACCTVLEVHPYRSEVGKVNRALRAKHLPLLQPSPVPRKAHLTPEQYSKKLKRIPQRHQRCVALEGTIGGHTACAIYEARPYNCSGFEPGDVHCLLLRLAHGVDSPKVAPDLIAYIARNNERDFLEKLLSKARECYAPGTRYRAQLQGLHATALSLYDSYAGTRRAVLTATEVLYGQGN